MRAARGLRALVLLAPAFLLGACAGRDAGAPIVFERPETAVDYEVSLIGAPSPEAESLLRESLQLFRQQAEGAQSLAFLNRRAETDVATAQQVLRSFGYYAAEATVEVEPLTQAAAAPGFPARDGAPPDGPVDARAALTLAPGPAFTLADHRFLLLDAGDEAPPDLDPVRLGSPVGGVAAARPILDAEEAAVARLKARGRPYAEKRGRDAVADLERAEIEVETTIATGPPFVFGPLRFEGLERVEADYLASYAKWKPGEWWDERDVVEFQRALALTGLFASVSVRAPETPPADGVAPVLVTAEEGPRRSASAGLRFSTDLGPAARGLFQHRNLFGRNETVIAEALVGTSEQEASARYRAPQFLRSGQDLLAGLTFSHIEDDAFDETAVTLATGLERRLSRWWVVGAGGLIELSDTTDGVGDGRFLLFGLPFYVVYDGTEDLLDPTEGARLRVDLIPFAGQADERRDPYFTSLDAVGSVYYPLDDARRYVLAGRARAGTIVTDVVDDVPAGRRFYSGGGASVRGFAARFIGPLDDDEDPVGGLSVLELGAELRARAFGDLGFAAFVEAGAVSEDPYPSFEDDPGVAAGVGLRYWSPVGPIRVDVGVPLNPRDVDDPFQLYLSIGQAY